MPSRHDVSEDPVLMIPASHFRVRIGVFEIPVALNMQSDSNHIGAWTETLGPKT